MSREELIDKLFDSNDGSMCSDKCKLDEIIETDDNIILGDVICKECIAETLDKYENIYKELAAGGDEMISTDCVKCIHNEVCRLKSVIHETERELRESKIGAKYPDIEVIVKCRKALTITMDRIDRGHEFDLT